MARYVPRTYKNGRAGRIILTVILSVIIAFVILTVTLFFGMRKYIVYTDDGLHLEIPWLETDVGDVSQLIIKN
jgi:hypothetical protein